MRARGGSIVVDAAPEGGLGQERRAWARLKAEREVAGRRSMLALAHVLSRLKASPDLRQQIGETPHLHPRQGLRSSPIAGVVLTDSRRAFPS